MNWRIALAVLCLLLCSKTGIATAENCSDCHEEQVAGVHAEQTCESCHKGAQHEFVASSSSSTGAAGCVGCHQGYERLFSHAMAKRTAEKQFVKRSYAKVDEHFYEKNCSSCHVNDCLDCHGQDGHQIARPTQQDCAACHKGYYVGMDYYGKAPREESQRYQRGEDFAGERVLKMQPDLHAELGMDCGACHRMQGLIKGQRTSRSCNDCHTPDPAVIEHSIDAHLEKMECYACHSAWAAQEYGSFFVRLGDNPIRKQFRLKTQNDGEYVKSVYLKKQGAPPLGLNAKGLVSPIRPQYISYYSDLRDAQVPGEENRLLTAEWKAFFPHTIRSGTPMCEGCHGNARRFLLEAEQDRIYLLQEEGMTLSSFWDRSGQQVINGAFFPKDRFAQMSVKNVDFTRAYVKKWKQLVDNVANSSKD